MKNTLLLLSLFISAIPLCAQTPSVVIEEDYSKSLSTLFNAADEFQTNSIENGMYVSKAARMHAQIDFPYALYDRQRGYIECSDMEYTIVKLKGDKESFICVQIDPNGDKAYPYLVFQYNELGDWKLTNYLQDKTYASGKTKVNPGTTANVIKIEHRNSKVRYSVNGELATELKSDNYLEIRWYNNKIYSKNKKFVIGLDKVILKGYQGYTKFPEEEAETAKKETVKKEEEVALKQKQLKELAQKQKKFPEGLCAVELNSKWGFIDTTGKEVIAFKYDYADNFMDGLAMVRVGKYPNYKHGFINKAGQEVVSLKYDKVGRFSNGLTSVCINDKYGFIDKSGNEIIPLTYGGTWDFREGLAMVRDGNFGVGKCGFIDVTGKVVIPLKYFKGDEGFKEGLALVAIDSKYGFIDKTGNEIIPLKYDFASSFREGLAVVKLNDKWGFIDKTGKEITPLKYDNVQKGGLADGLASVKLNNKWGFIDKTGKEIIPIQYDDVDDFMEGKTKVKLNGTEFYIDKTGKKL